MQWNIGVAKKQKYGHSMKISAEGISLIKKFEGCELESYQDSVGVWTIGFGHTKGVKEGMTITKEEADKMLEEELLEYEGYINDYIEVPLSQCQFDALVAWVYNLGPTNLRSSTLLKELNAGNYEEAPAQIKRWNKAGGFVLAGLERRREAGLPLGRPKGRQNSSLKLDKHRKDIVKYLDLKISKASIAKLVNCHPQTLYDWIDRHGIPDAKPRKPRTRFYTSATSTLTEKEEMLED